MQTQLKKTSALLRGLVLCTFCTMTLGATPEARATVANHTSIDDRDPLTLPFPAALATHDIYVGWQNEIHWDRSNINLSNGSQVSRRPSDGNNGFTLGWKAWDDFSFYVQTLLAARNLAFQTHLQYRLAAADADFPFDFNIGGGLGYSIKGNVLPEFQFVFGHTFRPAPRKNAKGKLLPGKGVVFTPQLVNGLRMMGQAFSAAALDGDPNSPYAGVTQRRLVFDSLFFLEAEWKGFVVRFGGGWEQLVQVYNTHEDTPGSNFRYESGPLLLVSLGASFSTDDL
ncbi:MAG: hypothetical protein HY074_12655 [Deltaproteobacteria bacterium]|nr:hypothetical protein [Deltaproteobacteria bacterium]